MKPQSIIAASLVVLAGIFTAIVYNRLPAVVPSHWNALGEVDAYTSRNTHVFLFLGLCTSLPFLMAFFPKLDPRYDNIRKFEGEYYWFIVAMTIFLVGLYVFTTLYALGYKSPIQNFMIPAISLLFLIVGYLLKKTKSNYSIGFRLPWTLHSEKNWDMTHQMAAQSITYGSLVLILTVFLGQYAFAIFITFLFVMMLVPVVYSYWLYRQGV